jgi:hypothetical protein
MKTRHSHLLAISLLCLVAPCVRAQQPDDTPEANPARPTISTPATLPPPGYVQFETGYLGAWNSPGVSSQSSFNEVAKLALDQTVEVLASLEPYARTRANFASSSDPGGVALGVQAIVHHGEGPKPTVAFSYFRQVYGGTAPDLDIGSSENSAVLLVSADVKGFHYDTNYLFNELVSGARRAQFGQTLSISHSLHGKFGLTGEVWRFTQPFLSSNAVGNLWALNYNARKNLVFDAGFQHGLTSTSAHWEFFTGFTYLLPHKIPGLKG